MLKIITKEFVKEKISSAETILDECFEMLLDFKHDRGDLGNILANFQPKLAECLYQLMQFYHELQKEKKYLISQKEKYSKQEFSTMMANNASFSKVVSQTIEIGKNLGDAYVWFFFRDNRSELDKHFQHNTTGLYVGGIGGLGELEFIKSAPTLNGLYVLYHGITTMLRIGDFSLYDGSLGIVGVGELKTKEEGDALSVTANITSKIDAFPYPIQEGNENYSLNNRVREIEKDFPRLKKQLSVHTELMNIKDAKQSADLYASYEYDLIDKLSIDNPIALNSDKSLLLLASWRKEKSLFDVLYVQETDYEIPQNLKKAALLLTEPPSQYNEFIIGKLNTQISLLSIPILWWEINDVVCKDLYFLKIDIATIFNPAKLLQFYIDDGFSVSNPGKLKDFEICKEIDGYRIGIGHFESICYLITNSLMKTRDVYAFSRKVIDSIEKGQFTAKSRIDMQIHLNNFGKPKKIIDGEISQKKGTN